MLFCAAMLALVAGCALPAPWGNWDQRVGKYTYAQAVKDMGPPMVFATFHQDGGTYAQWLVRDEKPLPVSFGMEAYAAPVALQSQYQFHKKQQLEAQGMSKRYLRMLFGPDGRMICWDRIYE